MSARRVIIVTGAAGIVGRAVVSRLAQDGVAVIGVDLAPSLDPLGQIAFVGRVDLTDLAAVGTAFGHIIADYGALDGLANIAGGFCWEEVGNGSVDTWDLLYRMNVRTTYNSCRTALPSLIAGKGSIVNFGAAAAVKSGGGMGPYAASKAGVARLTESLAEETKDSGVRVNAVLPAIIDTPANRIAMPDANTGRWVTPEALADVVTFLLSDNARAITGACLPVTGRT